MTVGGEKLAEALSHAIGFVTEPKRIDAMERYRDSSKKMSF